MMMRMAMMYTSGVLFLREKINRLCVEVRLMKRRMTMMHTSGVLFLLKKINRLRLAGVKAGLMMMRTTAMMYTSGVLFLQAEAAK